MVEMNGPMHILPHMTNRWSRRTTFAQLWQFREVGVTLPHDEATDKNDGESIAERLDIPLPQMGEQVVAEGYDALLKHVAADPSKTPEDRMVEMQRALRAKGLQQQMEEEDQRPIVAEGAATQQARNYLRAFQLLRDNENQQHLLGKHVQLRL